MQRILVLDAEKRPLMPCRPARARKLLTQHRAAVFRTAPLKTAGVHVGTISVRATGSCDLTTKHCRVGGVSVRYRRHLQRLDGYLYAQGSRALPPPAQAGSLRAQTR